MENKSKSDFSYYLLALLALLLIILPFFFLDLSDQGVGQNLLRLSAHAAAFGGAVLTAGALSTVVVKAMKSPVFIKFGSWTVGAIAATTVTVAAINLNTPLGNQEVALSDSLRTDSASVAIADTVAPEGAVVDTTTQEDGTSTEAEKEPKASFVKTTPKEDIRNQEEKKATSSDAKSQDLSGKPNGKDCKDEDVGVFLAGQKVNLKDGFSFGNRTKNIRIGDECGCTASSTNITVVDAGGKAKAEKTITSPFFSLQSITSLEATDRITAEVSDLKCISKDGAPTLKKIKKLFINIVFKADGSETTIRKRAAKELPKQEETDPVKKDKVEEEVLKYGN